MLVYFLVKLNIGVNTSYMYKDPCYILKCIKVLIYNTNTRTKY
jgi:hypothetical protein